MPPWRGLVHEPLRAAMRAASTIVYLHTQPDDLARRLGRDTQRPLLQVADPRHVYQIVHVDQFVHVDQPVVVSRGQAMKGMRHLQYPIE